MKVVPGGNPAPFRPVNVEPPREPTNRDPEVPRGDEELRRRPDSDRLSAVFRLTVRQSPIGPLTLAARGDQLVMVRFGDEREHAERFLHRQEPSAAIVEHRDPAGASTALDHYFTGDLAALDRLQVEFYGTDFQRRVWTALRAIGAGRTASYLDIASSIGAPSAVRAVGAANGANPIPIVVPCHRIIGTSGALVGYGGGLDRKRWLLEHDGAREEGTAGSDPLGVPLQIDHVHPFPTGEAIGEARGAAWCAAELAGELRASGLDDRDGWPVFDLIFLGIGPDGHLLSVFPDSPALDSPDLALAIPAPTHIEPRIERVTLNPAVLAVARDVLVVAYGEDKAAGLAHVLGAERDPRRWPGQLARRPGATWILDEAAASSLPR